MTKTTDRLNRPDRITVREVLSDDIGRDLAYFHLNGRRWEQANGFNDYRGRLYDAYQELLYPYSNYGAVGGMFFVTRRARITPSGATSALAGCVGIKPSENRYKTAELKRLLIDPALHRRGYGRALVTHAVEWTLAHGFDQIVLLTNTFEVAAHPLYESVGFRLTGEVPLPGKAPDLRYELVA